MPPPDFSLAVAKFFFVDWNFIRNFAFDYIQGCRKAANMIEIKDFDGNVLLTVDADTLRGHDFSNAELQGAVFVGQDLTGCNFENAFLSGADFSGCNLTNVNFTDAWLRDVDFEDATGTDTADYTFAELEGCSFERSGIRGHGGFSHSSYSYYEDNEGNEIDVWW